MTPESKVIQELQSDKAHLEYRMSEMVTAFENRFGVVIARMNHSRQLSHTFETPGEGREEFYRHQVSITVEL